MPDEHRPRRAGGKAEDIKSQGDTAMSSFLILLSLWPSNET